MLSSEKRANVTSVPRGGKESEAEEPAPAASLVALPRGGARQRLLASMGEAGTAERDSADEPLAAEASAGGGSVLVSKGDASASGFRPWYWSYERDGAPPVSDSAVSVTPFPASAPSPVSPPDPVSAPATSQKPGRRAVRPGLVAGCAALALIAGAGIAALHRLPPPAAAPPALAIAAPPPAAPAVVSAPAKPVAAAEPAPTISQPEMDELMARGRQMLATGDIVAARLFFERAAEAGNAAAAAEAGKTYDPLFLAEARARGIRGDPVAAARWYRQASAGGDREADGLMQRLMARYAG